VDYVHPVEAMIPGVQGRILGVLSRSELEMTIRTAARLARASPQQASVVITELVQLGVVSRREVGASALISLERANLAAQIMLALADLHQGTVDRLTACAHAMSPAPASFTVFGSFVRGEAYAGSDLDVLAVCPRGVNPQAGAWTDALGKWEALARRIVGNPVNIIVVGFDEVPGLLRRRSGPWRAIAREGIVLAGASVATLAGIA
jgi:hypothetical protein